MDDPQLTLASNIYDLQSLTQCSEHLTLALVAACFFYYSSTGNMLFRCPCLQCYYDTSFHINESAMLQCFL